MWAMEEYIEHEWWENAALLDLLGYSLDRRTRYCESPSPMINHLARGYHPDFETRLMRMIADRQTLPSSSDAR